MNNYLAHTHQERQDMLTTMGCRSLSDIYERVPASLQDFELQLPAAMNELELLKHMSDLANTNQPVSQQLAFVGGGAYQHFIPAALDTLISRSEFLTAYTPYQAEISQGTLQAIYEFQSMICELTGMDVANASLYEGATATAEAAMMAVRLTRREHLMVSPFLHPDYQAVLNTYAEATELSVSKMPGLDGVTQLNSVNYAKEPAALIIQYPNFMGNLENLTEQAHWIHERGGLLIVILTDLITLGTLEAPGRMGADIVAGEAQSCGNAISFGGPYVGFLAARKTHIRQIPGRLSGRAQDISGKPAFTLVLQTREQHIRRERATSNVCTNQGLNALAVTIWLTLLGRQGLQELSEICLQRAHYCAEKISEIPGFSRLFTVPFFHEFVVHTDYDIQDFFQFMESHGCLPGLRLERWYPEHEHHFLVTVTEMNAVADIERLLTLVRQFSDSQVNSR